MVSEHRKDQIEDVTATLAEMVFSLFPIVGGPAAIALNKSMAIAAQKRLELIHDEFRADITRLYEMGRISNPESVLTSDAFFAASIKTMRAAEETSNIEKRKILRNALLNSIGTTSVSEFFILVAAKYEPEHIVILKAVETISARTGKVVGERQQIREEIGFPVPNLEPFVRDLVNDGMLNEERHNRIREEITDGYTGKPVIWETRSLHIDDRGKAFLGFVSDPFKQEI